MKDAQKHSPKGTKLSMKPSVDLHSVRKKNPPVKTAVVPLETVKSAAQHSTTLTEVRKGQSKKRPASAMKT
jgi:hypothetical protein